MRKALLTLAVVAALLAGCASESSNDSTDASTSGSTAGTNSAEVARAPGVTGDAIKIGIAYVDLESIKQFVDLDHGDYEATYRALVDDLNRRGGINGRKVVPVFAPINPIGPAPAEAACLKLTQDEKVFVTMGYVVDEAVGCHVERNNSALLGGGMSKAELARATAPWFTAETGEDFTTDAIRALHDAGALDGKFAVFAAPGDKQLVDEAVTPTLKEVGAKPVQTAIYDAPPDDTAAATAATNVIAEKFKAAGVQKVLVQESAIHIWLQSRVNSTYRPTPIVIRGSSVQAWLDEKTRDRSVLKGMLVADVFGPAKNIYRDKTFQPCLEVLHKAGVKVVDPEKNKDHNGVEAARWACRYMKLFEAIAKKAGKDLNYATFRAAGDDLGKITLPGAPEPFDYGAPPHADGDQPVYLFRFNPQTEEMDLQKT